MAAATIITEQSILLLMEMKRGHRKKKTRVMMMIIMDLATATAPAALSEPTILYTIDQFEYSATTSPLTHMRCNMRIHESLNPDKEKKKNSVNFRWLVERNLYFFINLFERNFLYICDILMSDFM